MRAIREIEMIITFHIEQGTLYVMIHLSFELYVMFLVQRNQNLWSSKVVTRRFKSLFSPRNVYVNPVDEQMEIDDETTAYQLRRLALSKGLNICLRTI